MKLNAVLVMLHLAAAYSITTTPMACPLQPAVEQVCQSCQFIQDQGWEITCASSSLSTFPLIDTQETISKLYLQFNQIANIQASQINHLNIVELHLQNNELNSTEFLGGGGILPAKLQRLFLNGNQLLSYPGGMSRSHFAPLVYLRSLELNDILLTDVNFLRDPNNADHLKSLESVKIANNDLSGDGAVHRDTFRGKSHMVFLDAAASSISDIEFLKVSSLQNLTTLLLQRNQISQLLPADVRDLQALTDLNIRDNQLSGFGKEVMDNLVSIQTFDWGLNSKVQCNCAISWIRQWTIDNPDVMTYPSELESCKYITGSEVCPDVTSQLPPLPTTSTSTTTSATTTTTTATTTTRKLQPPQTTITPDTALPQYVIIIIVVAAAVVVIAIVVGVVLVVYKRQNIKSKRFGQIEQRRYRSEHGSGKIAGASIKSHHIYDYPDLPSTRERIPPDGADRNANSMADRPLPDKPGERVDKYGYILPVSQETPTKSVRAVSNEPVNSVCLEGHSDYNLTADNQEYLTPVNPPGKSANEVNDDYIDFNSVDSKESGGAPYESLKPNASVRVYSDIPRAQ